MIPGIITYQTGGRQYDAPDLTKYSMFVGGNNATYHALLNMSPLLNGNNRLFMVRPPYAILKMFAGSDAYLYSSDSLFIQFKHMMEYMLAGLNGIGDETLEAASTRIEGGFAGRSFSTPTVVKDSTTSFNVQMFELDGCPVNTVIQGWMNSIGDKNSGLAHYGGWISGGKDATGIDRRLYRRENESDEGIPYNEAMHTAEFIYLLHDKSGSQVQRAIMLADCYPLGMPRGEVFDFTPGNHDNVKYTIQFNTVVYDGPIVNAIANDLLKQYRIVSNSLNFNPELGDAVYANNNANLFNRSLGPVPTDSATGTNVGNIPAYRPTNAPKTVVTSEKDMNDAKLSGQPGRGAIASYYGFEEQ